MWDNFAICILCLSDRRRSLNIPPRLWRKEKLSSKILSQTFFSFSTCSISQISKLRLNILPRKLLGQNSVFCGDVDLLFFAKYYWVVVLRKEQRLKHFSCQDLSRGESWVLYSQQKSKDDFLLRLSNSQVERKIFKTNTLWCPPDL